MTLSEIQVEHITDDFVCAVEDEVGMGCRAWDMIDPKKIVAAVLAIAVRWSELKGASTNG